MYCKIGNLDITDYIALNGWSDSVNAVDGPNAGRNLNGTMIRDLVAVKSKIGIQLVLVNGTTLKSIHNALSGESVTVQYDDVDGTRLTKTMYSNNYTWKHKLHRVGNTDLWDFSFNLVEI